MDEPIVFLDQRNEENDKAGIAWLPLITVVLIICGLMVLPILGLLNAVRPGTKTSDWSNYTQNEGIKVGLDPIEAKILRQEPLLTPDPDELRDDLMSVDETLASLGTGDYVSTSKVPAKIKKGFSVTQKASLDILPGRKTVAESQVDMPTVKKTNLTELRPFEPGDPAARQIATQGDSSVKTAKRMPVVQQPQVMSVAEEAVRPEREVIVKPGDTLYGISRKTGSTPTEVSAINGISPNAPILVGQVLRVPDNDPVAGSQRTPGPRIVKPHQNVIGTPVKVATTRPPVPAITQRPVPRNTAFPQPVPGAVVLPAPMEQQALAKDVNPLDKWGHAIAYRVQSFDNLNRIADAHATTPEELISINGRAQVKKGEMLVVPVDNCLLKSDY